MQSLVKLSLKVDCCASLWGLVLEFPDLYFLACLLSTYFPPDLDREGHGQSLQVLVWAWIMASAFLDVEQAVGW